ncbi:hypothetical protein ACJMK2_037463 [Sinanodonta woodiana]|uniref:BTB domain-containing protein n=1 Tax=Sinanodonta woodiana TaxID=1069815 RepID=A0ABD3WKS6_SINWO
MASKFCASPKYRENSDDEVNQEVPPNYVPKSPIQRPPRPLEQCWKSRPNPPQALPTAKASREHNWQANQTTVRERNAVMFNNSMMADVYFRVGTPPNVQRIPAHKYILATGSSVFYAMFYGGLADNKMEDIELPDIEPTAFLNLLKYLYCDELDVPLAADNVLTTLYAAKKYIVPSLARVCVQYLETSLSAQNACILLSQGRLFEEQELMSRCWQVLDAQTEEALASDGFTEIDYSTLETVLNRETLNVREISVFKAMCRWAEAECLRKDLKSTPQNKRLVLGNLFYKIRIPSMTLEEFANGPAQSGILSQEETVNIFLHYTARIKPTLQFIKKSRTGLKPLKCHRFQSSAYRSNQWRYRGRCDSIQFAVDQRIFVAGFGLYGSSNGASEYQVRIELKKNGNILGHTFSRFFSDGSSNTFPVMFQNPIQVDPDMYYTASVVLDGPELSYFGQEGMAEIQTGLVTFQFQCSSDSTNGTGVQGGQIPEIIFYC